MKNRLENLAEFRVILDNYQLSEEGKAILASTKLVLLVGPSSSGRNTVIDSLIKSDKYRRIISDTTRKPRKNNGILEKDGREYWFRTESDMLYDLKAGRFLEAAIIHDQQVSGISLRELNCAQKEHKIALNEIETIGMQNIIEMKPDTLAFFVVPPSFSTWITRMNLRSKMLKAEIIRRLQSAVNEFKSALAHDYYIFIVNDNLDDTVNRIHAIAMGEVSYKRQTAEDRKVIEGLLSETTNYLNKL